MAGAFTVPKTTKLLLGQGSIVLSSGNFKLVFIKSGATLLSAGLSALTWASLKTDGITEMSAVGGYSASGKALAGVAWTQSGNNVKFDFTDFSLSASADILSLRGFLIRASAGDRIVCYSALSAASAVSSGNTLVLTVPTTGAFVLS